MNWDFPGGPVAKTPCSQCGALGLIPRVVPNCSPRGHNTGHFPTSQHRLPLKFAEGPVCFVHRLDLQFPYGTAEAVRMRGTRRPLKHMANPSLSVHPHNYCPSFSCHHLLPADCPSCFIPILQGQASASHPPVIFLCFWIEQNHSLGLPGPG